MPESPNLTNNSQKHRYRMVLITIAVLIVAVGGILISRQENLQQVLKGEQELPANEQQPVSTGEPVESVDVPMSTIADRLVPWLEIGSESGTSLTVGETKTLYIRGEMGDKDITGYDMLIAYDSNMLEIQSVSSALPDYEIFQFDRGNHMTITGIKNFQKRDPVTFNNATILEVVVKAKRAGNTVVSLNQSVGQEKTQLVDAEVQVIEPQIGSIQLTVQ